MWGCPIFRCFYCFFCFREVSKFNKLNLLSHFGPWKKSLNFILPTKYVIPKSLKVTLPGWVSSRGLFCFHLGEGNRLMKLAPRENWWLGLIKSPFKIAAHSFIFGGGGGPGVSYKDVIPFVSGGNGKLRSFAGVKLPLRRSVELAIIHLDASASLSDFDRYIHM